MDTANDTPTKESHHRCNVLNADQVRDIRARMKKGGVTQIVLAEEYGVTKMTISHIVNYVTWKDIPDEVAS